MLNAAAGGNTIAEVLTVVIHQPGAFDFVERFFASIYGICERMDKETGARPIDTLLIIYDNDPEAIKSTLAALICLQEYARDFNPEIYERAEKIADNYYALIVNNEKVSEYAPPVTRDVIEAINQLSGFDIEQGIARTVDFFTLHARFPFTSIYELDTILAQLWEADRILTIQGLGRRRYIVPHEAIKNFNGIKTLLEIQKEEIPLFSDVEGGSSHVIQEDGRIFFNNAEARTLDEIQREMQAEADARLTPVHPSEGDPVRPVDFQYDEILSLSITPFPDASKPFLIALMERAIVQNTNLKQRYVFVWLDAPTFEQFQETIAGLKDVRFNPIVNIRPPSGDETYYLVKMDGFIFSIIDSAMQNGLKTHEDLRQWACKNVPILGALNKMVEKLQQTAQDIAKMKKPEQTEAPDPEAAPAAST